jgi:hypothetical protein
LKNLSSWGSNLHFFHLFFLLIVNNLHIVSKIKCYSFEKQGEKSVEYVASWIDSDKPLDGQSQVPQQHPCLGIWFAVTCSDITTTLLSRLEATRSDQLQLTTVWKVPTVWLPPNFEKFQQSNCHCGSGTDCTPSQLEHWAVKCVVMQQIPLCGPDIDKHISMSNAQSWLHNITNLAIYQVGISL